MALVAIHVKKPREAQIWNCCTGNPVLRILPDSKKIRQLTLVGSIVDCRMFCVFIAHLLWEEAFVG